MSGYYVETTGQVEAKRAPGALEDLASEIESLSKLYDMLAAKLACIRSQYAGPETKVDNVPRPEPATAFRTQIEQLSRVRAQFATLAAEIDL